MKEKAQKLVKKALKLGIIEKGRCAECNVKIVEAHHEDYSEPLVVVWLCKTHHKLWHSSLKRYKIVIMNDEFSA
jgi:hypothetical protein